MEKYGAEILLGVLIILISWMIQKVDKLVNKEELARTEERCKSHTEKQIMKHPKNLKNTVTKNSNNL